jgi:hypothetical protein
LQNAYFFTAGKHQFMPHQNKEAFFHSISTRSADPLLLRLFDFTQLLEIEVLAAHPKFASPLFAGVLQISSGLVPF